MRVRTQKKDEKKVSKQHFNQAQTESNEPMVFSFGDPIPVNDTADILNYLETSITFNKYYEPPISTSYLAKAVHSASHHSSALEFKKNTLLSTCETSKKLPRKVLEQIILDYLVFANAYCYFKRNIFGQLVSVEAPLAKYMRVGTDSGVFYQVNNYVDDYQFDKDSIYHIKAPDINQEIYGVPSYLAALHSAFLNESATLFRRKYYINGAHAGTIIYLTDPLQNKDSVESLKQSLKNARGQGNFKNLLVYAPDGKKDGLQTISLSEATAKDEFLNIKNVSRDDILAAHRVPPQLMGIIPSNVGGFGDIVKAAEVFFINEIIPLQKRLHEINDAAGEELIKFTEYKLLAVNEK